MKPWSRDRVLSRYGLGVYVVWALGLFLFVGPSHPYPPWWYVAIPLLPFVAIPLLFVAASVLRRLDR